ncbi:MAG: hemerythrin domain-containing protein [Elusimicrobia bacterium]|nr:hemerythrin domain-containing protein [Elusimicrobiota bacterium]
MPASLPARLRSEHKEIRALCARLKEALGASPLSRAALVSALDSLLPRVLQHEAWEREAAGGRLGAFAGEHLSLRSLAKDVMLVASHPDLYPNSHLGRLAESLADALSSHLDREEAALA